MIEQDLALGGVVRGDGHVHGTLETFLEASPEETWSAIVDPTRLKEWLAPAEIDLRPGGAVRIAFEASGAPIESRITDLAPGRVIAYGWDRPGEPSRPIRWEVSSAPGGSSLTLRLALPEGEDAARAFAGWAAHLDMLAVHLAGGSPQFPLERFKAAREAFGRHLEATAG